MNIKKYLFPTWLFAPLFVFTCTLCAAAQDNPQASTNSSQQNNSSKEEYISLKYDGEDILNIINYLAGQTGRNVVFPPEPIKANVTWHLEKKVTAQQAWDYLLTFLDVAGYSMIPKAGNMYKIVKNVNNISREPVPLYINTPHEMIPNTDQRIWYIYYPANIKLTEDPNDELKTVLKELLPAPASNDIRSDVNTNSIILMAKAAEIKGAIELVNQLDKPGFQEKMEPLPLKYASARVVADLFNQNILKPANELQRYRLDAQKQSEASYFSRNTRIIAYERTNTLILLGRSQAIDRIRKFILEYIDVELDSGKSILHVYQLQYLDAAEFAPVLENIIRSTKPGGAEQAQAAQGAPVKGAERYFDQVIIKVDTPAGATQQEGAPTPYYGGNKLVIAAREDDWKRIKKLIEELDTPQPQVLIEVLIADLTIDDQRLLGSLLRNPAKVPILSGMNAQAAHIDPGIITDSFDNPRTLGVLEGPDCKPQFSADLLRQFSVDSNGNRTDGNDTSAAAAAGPGSTVISLNDSDGNTWGILQLIKLFGHSKILSHPHVVATNNQKATVEVSETRLLVDEGSGSLGGTTVQTRKPITAKLQVTITPRISASKTVNLQVGVDINEFIDGGANAQITRNVITNANINDGDILALGGLIRLNTSNNVNETPVLSKIPILGNLFKRRSGNQQKNNLTVFISPTIVEPRLRRGASEFTKDYLDVAHDYAREGKLFDQLRDPITRWFFKTGADAEDILTRFMEKDEAFAQEKELEQESKGYETATKPEPPKKRTRSRRARRFGKKPENQPAAPITPINKMQEALTLKELIEQDENPFEKKAAPAA